MIEFGRIRAARLVIGPSLAVATAAALVSALSGVPAHAEDAEVSARRAAERTNFSNDEIKDGFFKTAFRGELQFDRAGERIRKFDGPVRVFVDNRGEPDRRAELAAIVADIRAHIDHFDLAMTQDRARANFVVTLVPRRQLEQTILAHYGRDDARAIDRKLAPECLSGIAKDGRYRIRRAEAILPVDNGDFFFYDCAYEELLQGLGIVNDDKSVPWTMFNDDVQMGFFDIYDQYLLNILYDPRVRPGMTKNEVDRLLPEVLPAVRTWVTSVNPPRDARPGANSHAALAAKPHGCGGPRRIADSCLY
jgi:hypothetical protein